METNPSRRFGIERWFTLILVIIISIASLIPGASFLALFLWPYSSDPTAMFLSQLSGLIMSLLCLSCLAGSFPAVFLSLLLYMLVAFLVTLRTRNGEYGRWAALLAAFLSILVACFTYQIISVLPLPDFSQATLLKALMEFQKPPSFFIVFLGVGQAIHAGIGGFIGSVLARVLLHPRYVRSGSMTPTRR